MSSQLVPAASCGMVPSHVMQSEPSSVELTIESLAAGGDGVARDSDGRVTFVPLTAVGDRIRARVTEQKKRFARAEIEAIVEASPDRVEPVCPLYAECGGCQWQHVSAAAQATAKQSIVASALRRAIDDGMELRPLQTPVSALGWRRRARLHWAKRRKDRGVLLGFYKRGSRHIVDVAQCPQLEPALQRALSAVREHLAPALSGTGELSMVAGHTGEVHVGIHGNCAEPQAVLGAGGIVGVRAGSRTWGAEQVEIEPGLTGSAAQFAQASRGGNEALCAAVDAATRPRDDLRILELYAGRGNLTRTLADGAKRVTAVDTDVGDKLDRVSWRKGDVVDVVATMVEVGREFQLAVLDPPRAGAAEVLPALLTLRPQRIVYVSCDPATLGRDIDRLRTGGYKAVYAQPIDLMPQTSHVEVVVSLEI